MLVLSLALAVILNLVSFLPLLRVDAWWIRILDFSRLQIAFAALLLLAAEALWLELDRPLAWLALALTALCLLYQAAWILPYTPLFRKEVQQAGDTPPANRLSLLNANVLGGNRNCQALLEHVRHHQPDILVTLETDQWWQDQLAVLEQDYPHSIKCAQDNLYGMHLYSRLPLVRSEVCRLLEPGIPSIHTLIRLRCGAEIAAHFLHPRPPVPPESDSSSPRDAELLIVARRVADKDEPVLVAGDLNDVAWSRTTRLFRKISRLLDPRIGRGMFNTFHASLWFLRWPLDHIFHSRHFSLIRMRRLGAIGSDHFPLYCELAYAADRDYPDSSISPDQEDRDHAREKIEAADAGKEDVPDLHGGDR